VARYIAQFTDIRARKMISHTRVPQSKQTVDTHVAQGKKTVDTHVPLRMIPRFSEYFYSELRILLKNYRVSFRPRVYSDFQG
jgi:hypothetical protein